MYLEKLQNPLLNLHIISCPPFFFLHSIRSRERLTISCSRRIVGVECRSREPMNLWNNNRKLVINNHSKSFCKKKGFFLLIVSLLIKLTITMHSYCLDNFYNHVSNFLNCFALKQCIIIIIPSNFSNHEYGCFKFLSTIYETLKETKKENMYIYKFNFVLYA